MDHLLSAIYYHKHKWSICGDLKMVDMVLGLQGRITKYPCFLYLEEGRANITSNKSDR